MKVLNNTTMQEHFYREQYAEVCTLLLNFKFSSPDKDQAMIREHAYLMGKKDFLAKILEDDWPVPDMEQS